MVSNRIKADARAFMTRNPGISYQAALRAVTAPSRPEGDVGLNPRIPTFLEALGIENLDTHDFPAVWEAIANTEELRVPIGVARNSDQPEPELVYLDLRDALHGGDGPHVAVAGRTGSGKSHLMRGVALSLASTYGPDQVALVLADFKGGTFHGLEQLPHTVFSMTGPGDGAELGDSLVRMLRDELDRRNQLISGDKGLGDVSAYRAERRKHADDPSWSPLPDLVVMVDEMMGERRFAAKLSPVLRITRALGVHLFMSTQRWDGEYDELSQHVSFRIALPGPGDYVPSLDQEVPVNYCVTRGSTPSAQPVPPGTVEVQSLTVTGDALAERLSRITGERAEISEPTPTL